MRTARFLIAFLFIIAISVILVLGQESTVLPGNPPVELMTVEVSIADMAKWQSNGTMSSGMGSGMGTAQISAETEKQLLFTLKCKNIGNKQISNIQWESRFTDAKDKLVLKQFKSKKKIKPGKDETIEEPMAFDFKKLPDSVKIGFHVTKIEFDDKSSWENDLKAESDASYLYRLYKLK